MANGTGRAYRDSTELILFDEGDRLSDIARQTGRSKSAIVRILIRAVNADIVTVLNSTTSELRSNVRKAIEEERRR